MTDTTPSSRSGGIRLALIGAIGALLLVLVLQNFDTTEVQFLFWKAEAPLALVILVAMLIGVGLQTLVKAVIRRKRRQAGTGAPSGG